MHPCWLPVLTWILSPDVCGVMSAAMLGDKSSSDITLSPRLLGPLLDNTGHHSLLRGSKKCQLLNIVRSVSVFFYCGCKTVLSNSRVLVHVSHSKDMSSSSNVMMKDRHLRCTQNIYEEMKIKSHKSKAWKTVVHEKEMLKKIFKNWANIFVMPLRKHRRSLTRSKYWSKSLAVQKRTW